MENLSSKQLMIRARDYDRDLNEGGEGYNPFLAELGRRNVEMKSANIAVDNFAEEWTLETTKARRIEWNEFANSSTSKTLLDLDMKQRELGWTTTNLKKAIKLHNL